MSIAHILGFPRIGKNREMKKVVEAYWAQTIDLPSLLQAGSAIRKENWKIQKDAGLDFITVGDFSWYDQILDTAVMLGVVPNRFQANQKTVDLETIFRMARGHSQIGVDVPACEMTKWFDTNYHYIVPELKLAQSFHLAHFKLFEEIEEAQALGHHVKPVLIGPLTFLWLAKCKEISFDKLSLVDKIIDIYLQILSRLKSLKIEWVQIDEPILGLDLPQSWLEAFKQAYLRLNSNDIKLLLTTYFTSLANNAHFITQLPVQGIHADLTQDFGQFDSLIKMMPNNMVLSAGIINGRNIWKNDLSTSYHRLLKAQERLQERLWIGSSCSLLHVPVDLSAEEKMEHEIKSWLAFAVQKVEEVSTLAKALTSKNKLCLAFKASDTCVQSRQNSTLIHCSKIKERVAAINDTMLHRKNNYAIRTEKQKKKLLLPLFPTTTIGSFPQTSEIRNLRHNYKNGMITEALYEEEICTQIQNTITTQEEIGLDVLVHGESERNDMIEYFAELLQGFSFTQNGWVQSYGSRFVKPPILFGDVARTAPMTVAWIKYAQSLTSKPLKGMLTGPITMLSWSFVRDDQPRSETAMQIALAIRDEVVDLEANGIQIIQVDEPAFRESLPLRQQDWSTYLTWAVKAFRLASCAVDDSTQIHTHMCYSEFNDIIKFIAELDADVITIETSRSQMELLSAFENFDYPNQIGPGVFDVHSPRIPTIEEIVDLLNKAAKVISVDRLWVNPDCGLKTRTWPETKQALRHMVSAAKIMREKYSNHKVRADL